MLQDIKRDTELTMSNKIQKYMKYVLHNNHEITTTILNHPCTDRQSNTQHVSRSCVISLHQGKVVEVSMISSKSRCLAMSHQ